MKTFKKIIYLLSKKERTSAAFLLFMISVMAITEMIGVASILPFMAVLSNPDVVQTNSFLKYLFEFSKIFGVTNNRQFLFYLGIFVFLILVISLIIRAITIYLQVRFVRMREFSIGRRLVELYLKQPYIWFLNQHSSEIGKTILSEIDRVIVNGLGPLVELIARCIVTVLLIGLLLIVDTKLTLIVFILLSGLYIIIYLSVKWYLKKIGKISLLNNKLRFLAVNNTFSAIKEIKVKGVEREYLKNFSDPAKAFAQVQSSAAVISLLPRFLIEAIAFGGLLLIMLYLMSNSGNFIDALPTITLYAFAGYRLLPSIQQIYLSFTKLTFIGPSLDNINSNLINLKSSNLIHNKSILPLNRKIELKNINFRYPDMSEDVLNNLNITIYPKTTVGFIGSSGSGKTTIIDIILGLLQPQSGTLEVDGNSIDKRNLRAWQNSLGYVPQNIYLLDDTIEANIALGQSLENINKKSVEKALKIANLYEFVNKLPKKDQTKVGENGVRISGGQRQRIGIARALYHNPNIIILDEATSSLDNENEKAVMQAVNNLSKYITVIIVAHRLNTVKNCDVIFKIKKGQVVDQGSYDKIFKKNNLKN